MINRLLFLLMFLVMNLSVVAQQMSDQNWKTEEDFQKDEQLVLNNIIWLEDHPLATDTNDTKAISAYVLNWISNTPTITVNYDEIFLAGLTNSKKYKFGEKFRVTYLFGKSYFVLTQPNDEDEAKACARGISGMVKVYNQLKKIDPSVKNKLLDKYARLVKNNKVETYTQDRLAKSAI